MHVKFDHFRRASYDVFVKSCMDEGTLQVRKEVKCYSRRAKEVKLMETNAKQNEALKNATKRMSCFSLSQWLLILSNYPLVRLDMLSGMYRNLDHKTLRSLGIAAAINMHLWVNLI